MLKISWLLISTFFAFLSTGNFAYSAEPCISVDSHLEICSEPGTRGFWENGISGYNLKTKMIVNDKLFFPQKIIVKARITHPMGVDRPSGSVPWLFFDGSVAEEKLYKDNVIASLARQNPKGGNWQKGSGPWIYRHSNGKGFMRPEDYKDSDIVKEILMNWNRQ